MAENMRDMTLNLIVNSEVGKLKEFNKNLKNTEKTIDDTTKKVGWLGKTFMRVFGTYLSFRGIQGIVRTYRELDLMRRSIEGLTKSTQDWDYIQQQAFKTGTSIDQVAKGYRNFYSAANMAGFDKGGIQQMYSDVLVASRAIGASQQQVGGALLALEQMLSKGTVSMEELRRQLGNALPGAFEIGAKAMNMTTMEFNKFIKTGKLASAEFVPKFTKELLKTYEGAFPEAVKSLDYALVNLDSAWRLLQYDLMKGDAGREFAKVIRDISKILQSPQFKNALTSLGVVLGHIVKLIGFLVNNLGTILWLLAPIAIGGAIEKIVVLLKEAVKWLALGNLRLNATQIALFRLLIMLAGVQEIIAFFTPMDGALETALLGKDQSWINRLKYIIADLLLLDGLFGFKVSKGLLGLLGGSKIAKGVKTFAGTSTVAKVGSKVATSAAAKAGTSVLARGIPIAGQVFAGTEATIAILKAITGQYQLEADQKRRLKDIETAKSLRNKSAEIYQAPSRSFGASFLNGFAQLSKTETNSPTINYEPKYQINANSMTPQQLKAMLDERDRDFWTSLLPSIGIGGTPSFAGGK